MQPTVHYLQAIHDFWRRSSTVIHVPSVAADSSDMGVSAISGSSTYLSSGAADAARVMQVLRKEQDVARDVGQALVQLITDSAPQVGGRFSVRV
jgi:hypothetical protein